MKEPTLSPSGQIAILVSLVLLFIVVIVAAPSMKQSSIASTDKRLRAKAGTERKGVRALVSDSAPASSERNGESGSRDEPLEAWTAPKNWERLQDMEEAGLADGTSEWRALNGLEPAKSLAAVQAQLAGPQNLAAVARLYATMGKLYTYQNPPSPTLAAEAFDRAFEAAQTAEDRHEITQSRLLSLAEETSPEEALALIEAAVQPGDETTLAGLELGISKGNAYERLERPEDAVETYRQVLDDSAALMEGETARAESVCRQAAMRLAGLYRAMGREEEARAVVRELHRMVK